MRCCPVKEDILLSPRPIRAKCEWRVGTKHLRCFVPRSAAAPAQVRAPHEENTQGAACSQGRIKENELTRSAHFLFVFSCWFLIRFFLLHPPPPKRLPFSTWVQSYGEFTRTEFKPKIPQSVDELATLDRYHHFHGHSGLCAWLVFPFLYKLPWVFCFLLAF